MKSSDAPGGYIKLHRALLTDELWTGKSPTQRLVIVELLLRVNYLPTHERIGKHLIPVDAGQMLFSARRFATDIGISESTLRYVLAALEKDGFIHFERLHRHSSILTIPNWNYYQGSAVNGVNKKKKGSRIVSRKFRASSRALETDRKSAEELPLFGEEKEGSRISSREVRASVRGSYIIEKNLKEIKNPPIPPKGDFCVESSEKADVEELKIADSPKTAPIPSSPPRDNGNEGEIATGKNGAGNSAQPAPPDKPVFPVEEIADYWNEVMPPGVQRAHGGSRTQAEAIRKRARGQRWKVADFKAIIRAARQKYDSMIREGEAKFLTFSWLATGRVVKLDDLRRAGAAMGEPERQNADEIPSPAQIASYARAAGLWEQILALYHAENGDGENFRKLYEYHACGMDAHTLWLYSDGKGEIDEDAIKNYFIRLNFIGMRLHTTTSPVPVQPSVASDLLFRAKQKMQETLEPDAWRSFISPLRAHGILDDVIFIEADASAIDWLQTTYKGILLAALEESGITTIRFTEKKENDNAS